MTLPVDETAEHCPECEGRIPPESATCPACHLELYDEDLSPRFRRPVRVAEGEFVETRPVFAGTLSEVMATRAALATKGFETFIQDDWVKVMDPFITGGFCLGATLRAAEDEVAKIAQVIADDRAEAEAAERETAEENHALADLDRRLEGFRDLGQRIGWCAVSTALAPVGLVFAWFYLGELLRFKRFPPGINFAFFGLVLCLFHTLTLSFIWFLMANWFGHGAMTHHRVP
jgi:hypothetical protein